MVYPWRYRTSDHNVNGIKMKEDKFSYRQALVMGGGMMTGLGVGFFLLQSMGGLAFVGSLMAGIGLGLLFSAIIK